MVLQEDVENTMNMRAIIQGNIKKKEELENVTLTGQCQGKRVKGKQCITYLVSLSKWMVEQVLGEIMKRQNLISTTKNRKL